MPVADELDEGLTDLQPDSDVTAMGSAASSQHVLDAVHAARKLYIVNKFRAAERQWELQVLKFLQLNLENI